MIHEKEYEHFLKEKTIAVVGPARSIQDSKNGDLIDSCDVVVRLNYAKIKNSKDSGTRTDVIYYDGSLHDYSNLKIKFLICSYPKVEWFFESRCKQNVRYYNNFYNHQVVDCALYSELKKSLSNDNKVRPNTGLIAMVDLLSYDIKSLFITGIDFYRTAYLNTHPDYGNHSLDQVKNVFKSGDNGDYHDTEAQFEYFKNNLIIDDRVLTDEFLSKQIKLENKNVKY